MPDITTTEQWPIDYGNLSKGDLISAEQCERIIRASRTEKDYQLKLLGLRDRIMIDMNELDMPVILRTVKGESLRVLMDAEATDYAAQTAALRVRGIARSLLHLTHYVDAAELTQEEQVQHTRNICVVAGILSGARKGKREAVKAIAHERQTPGLPQPAEA